MGFLDSYRAPRRLSRRHRTRSILARVQNLAEHAWPAARVRRVQMGANQPAAGTDSYFHYSNQWW